MDIVGIAKELAVACLSHQDVAKYLGPGSTSEEAAKKAGERLGAFYNAILKALEQEASSSTKEQKSWKY